ncbi:hypothetical protein LTR37_014097 [Vermiconidia calcicola]|uniref:Uncharacterized protein n=1 Tax=Vermiconidia calcicola TaxID=1690605 RepID=A0ACC3MXD6_9PEZI|nr:hypothetical protein LTR37_014097 [Vermiconidia calcicola]
MASANSNPHWLDQYGNAEHYKWRTLERNGRTTFHRPLGLVEFAFDGDGRYFEGRADMNVELEVEIKTTLTNKHDFRERILFAWTCLRSQHALLQSKALPGNVLFGPEDRNDGDVYFAIDAPRNVSQAIEDGGKQLVFLDDHFETVDPIDFWVQCQNVARVIDPSEALAKMFVYPLVPTKGGCSTLRFLAVKSHQISDGLTMYIWFRNFVHYLNMTLRELRQRLVELMEPKGLHSRLPLPQEALYPPITGSRARQRWFWLLTRILRHVRKPLQAGFENPLQRRLRREVAIPPSPIYAPVLDYSKTPPLNSTPCFAKASLKATKRLHRLCREANASVGAGCFALAALIMMEFYERREPNVPLAKRRPFISGFPLNPRAFFNHTNEPDSLMLAFCDGILLPFLSSDLDLDGRLRLLARQAHRQLAVYQKRANPKRDDTGIQYMSSTGAGRLLPIQYIGSVERKEFKQPDHLKTGINPQGAYPMRPNMTTQTCGVSSVGRTGALVEAGIYNINDDSKDFVAEHRNVHANVRARDNEFLVGVGGSDEGLWANVSIDASAMDPELVGQWRERFQTILEGDVGELLSKL